MAISAYSKYCRTGESWHLEGKPDARIISNRTALLPDGDRLRITPPNQDTVEDLVFPGDLIETSYGSHGKVVRVSKHSCYGLPIYTIVYVPEDAKPNKDGSYRRNQLRWINECVAQDGRILQLFEANDDEILVKKSPQRRLFDYGEE